MELRLAQQLGLAVPRTLFSNEPALIRDFLRVEPYQLPPEVEDRCLLLMEQLGLVFGQEIPNKELEKSNVVGGTCCPCGCGDAPDCDEWNY